MGWRPDDGHLDDRLSIDKISLFTGHSLAAIFFLSFTQMQKKNIGRREQYGKKGCLCGWLLGGEGDIPLGDAESRVNKSCDVPCVGE